MALFAGWLGACDQNVSVTGAVRDPGGRALEDVVVTLETSGRAPDVAHTDKDGTFNVGIVGADPRKTHLSFRKEGYLAQARDLDGEARPTLAIVLVPRAP
jgi:hypothetical protein